LIVLSHESLVLICSESDSFVYKICSHKIGNGLVEDIVPPAV